MSLLCLQFLPKNEFICSFFGTIHGLTICFRHYLTFITQYNVNTYYLKFQGNLFLLKDMQDLVLQYFKKTVLRPRAVGKSEFLGGQVIAQCISKENVLFLFLAFYLRGRLPLCPVPTVL